MCVDVDIHVDMNIYVDVDIFVYADQVRSIKSIEPQTRTARQFKFGYVVFSTLKYKYFLYDFLFDFCICSHLN